MPDEYSVRLENASKLPDYTGIVRRVREKAERSEQVEHGIKAASPLRWHAAHVPTRVTKSLAGAAPARDVQQLFRVIERVHVVAELGQQVRVPALSARHIQHARAIGESKELDQPGYFLTIPREREEWAVLQEVMGVEGRLPPLARFLQKKTGSR